MLWKQAVTPWQALYARVRGVRQTAPAAPLQVRFERDPDLDTAHERQHDLLNVATSMGLRDQMAERMRRRWRLEAEFWQRTVESHGGPH
jgi:hypothetical protein